MATLDEHRERLTKNTAYLTAAFVGQKLLSSATYFVYANLLRPETTGAFLFVIAVANLFSIFVDVGISPILIREVAREPHRARSLFRATVRLKALLGLGTLALIALTAPWFIQERLRLELLAFAAVFAVLESFSLSAYGVLRGLQRLRFEAIGSTLAQAVPFVIVSVGLWLTRNPVWLGVALIASAATNLGYAAWHVRRVTAAQESGGGRLPWSAKTISPFFFAGILQRIYGYIDVVLMGVLVSGHFVGLYGTAYRITYATQFLPIAFNTSLYPALSQAFHDSRATLQSLVEQSLRVLLTLGSAVAVILGVLARPLLTALFPQYTDATLALQISLASAPFLFLNFLFASLLNATNRQSRMTLALLLVAAASIGFNLAFVPAWKHVGASLAAVAATAIYSLSMAWFGKTFIRLTADTGRFTLRLLLTCAVTAAVGLSLAGRLHIGLTLPLTSLTFAVALVGTRTFSGHDLRSVLRVFRKQPA